MMKTLKGLGILRKIAIGRAWHYKRKKQLDLVAKNKVDPMKEIHRFDTASQFLKNSLEKDQKEAASKGFREKSEILEAHLCILDDVELVDSVKKKIKEDRINAEYALKQVSDQFIEEIKQIQDDYLRQRARDIDDVRTQLITILLGVDDNSVQTFKHDVILVADDFYPSDAKLLELPEVKGCLSAGGSTTTHFSILAKSQAVPLIVNISGLTAIIEEEDLLIIDGKDNTVVINPDPKTLKKYQDIQKKEIEFENKLKELENLPTKTRDGVSIPLLGNISNIHDIELLKNKIIKGIGLFRTEFLYMNRKSAPKEEEQFQIYKTIVQAMGEDPVVIRTMDIGGDKPIDYLNLKQESNPFLGLRAIRYCLHYQSVFKEQIRAILRASAFGNIKIMFPMISCLEEIKQAKEILSECENELSKKGEKFKKIDIGIMIEVPSAAIIADTLAKEVDFFSIGTNDLLQYLFAIDRLNSDLSYLYHPYHPSFIRILKTVISAAHQNGIKVSVCGELASDPLYIPVFLGLDVDQLSMNPHSILHSHHQIRSLDKQKTVELADKLLTFSSAEEMKLLVEKMVSSDFLK